MTEQRKNKNLLLVILFLVLLEAFLFYTSHLKIEKEEMRKQAEVARIEAIKNSFESIPIFAKAVSVYDLSTGKEIYGENQNKVLPLASLMKTMTVIVALDSFDTKKSIFEVSKISTDRSYNNSLILGEKWKIEDLAKFTLISSSNDGALVLSKNSKDFLFRMNIFGKEIGLSNTEFFNFTGLDVDSEKAGAYGSAFDMNLLANYAIKKYPEVFQATIFSEMDFKSESGLVHKATNTNTIIDKIPNIIFSKTGLTTLAGGNLTVVFKNKAGHIIAITLLGSTKEGRFTDMEKLVEIAYNLDDGSRN